MPFDYDAHTRGLLNAYLDAQDNECPDCGEPLPEEPICGHCGYDYRDNEPDPDRFRDEDPNELDREDY